MLMDVFGESRRIIGEKYSPDDVDEWSINGVNLTEKNPSLSNPPFASSST